MARVPQLVTVADMPANDAWKGEMLGLYTSEVTIRRAEHECLDDLRAKGVIR